MKGFVFTTGAFFFSRNTWTGFSIRPRRFLLTLPMTRNALREAVLETCRQNNLRDGYIRLVVTRGKGDLGLNPNSCAKPTVFIIAATIQLYPEKFYTEGLRVNTVPTQRVSPAALSPGDQVAELPEQHPGEDRGESLRRPGIDLVESTGVRSGVYGG